jgi:isopenicillin-N epimerase
MNDSEAAFGRSLLPLWGLAPGWTHLNHGAFGATPRELQAAQDAWRSRMEANPTRFFTSELGALLREAARPLSTFVGASADRLAFVENASQGAAAVVRSLDLKAGDEIVTTDHVYNAVRLLLRHVTERAGARVIEVPIGMPAPDGAAIAAAVAAALTERTRLLVLDHIASASAVVLPVAALIAEARSRGVPTFVDGAHAPGHVELDVDALGADFYVGNCHKWLCAPKGAAFLAARAPAPFDIHPTVISHSYGQGFPLEFDKIGSRDPSPWLVVPAAIALHERLGGAKLRRRAIALAETARARLVEALGTEAGAGQGAFGAMATVRLPTKRAATRENAAAIGERLRADRIEAPVMAHSGALWLRVSIAPYVEMDDVERLVDALPGALAGTEAGA